MYVLSEEKIDNLLSILRRADELTRTSPFRPAINNQPITRELISALADLESEVKRFKDNHPKLPKSPSPKTTAFGTLAPQHTATNNGIEIGALRSGGKKCSS